MIADSESSQIVERITIILYSIWNIVLIDVKALILIWFALLSTLCILKKFDNLYHFLVKKKEWYFENVIDMGFFKAHYVAMIKFLFFDLLLLKKACTAYVFLDASVRNASV